MYYLLFNTKKTRDNLLEFMKNRGIKSVFHYIPLHRSKLGKKYLKTGNRCNISDTISERLIRLPMFTGLAEKQIKTIIDEIKNFLRARFAAAMRA
jgi:dTDP-4-amino-4,6-dideoxygalactose transaminase